MVEKFKISCSFVFGNLAKEIYYEYDVVYTQESIKENGYILGTNFAVITGKIVDEEENLKKLFCDELKWRDKMHALVLENNAKYAIDLFEVRKGFLVNKDNEA